MIGNKYPFFALPMVHYFLRASILGVFKIILERFQSAPNGVFIAFLEELEKIALFHRAYVKCKSLRQACYLWQRRSLLWQALA
jgi:hypothetical protein